MQPRSELPSAYALYSNNWVTTINLKLKLTKIGNDGSVHRLKTHSASYHF